MFALISWLWKEDPTFPVSHLWYALILRYKLELELDSIRWGRTRIKIGLFELCSANSFKIFVGLKYWHITLFRKKKPYIIAQMGHFKRISELLWNCHIIRTTARCIYIYFFFNLSCYKTNLIASIDFYFKNSNINSIICLFVFSLIVVKILSVSICWWILKIETDIISLSPNILTWNLVWIKLQFWMDYGTLPLWMDMGSDGVLV